MKYFLVVVAALGLAGCGGPGPETLSGAIRAAKLGQVSGPGACGVENAYSVTEAGGVRLSHPATLSRKAVNQLDRWLREQAVPAIGRKGGGLVEIRVASHYACRSRNSQSGARLSEHARGNAIDISAFVLADGRTLTVLNDWDGPDARLMRRLHASACGPFGTVLGPDADRHHQDHFHLDVADYRNGSFCQ